MSCEHSSDFLFIEAGSEHADAVGTHDLNCSFTGVAVSMSSALDSKAAFVERCKFVGVSGALLSRLLEEGYDTFGKLAFAAGSSPQTTADESVDRWLLTIEDPLPSAFQMSCIRRILYEAQNLALGDIKFRALPEGEHVVRKLPAAERVARLDEQRTRLSGVILTPSTLPANSCIDLCCDMLETGSLKYIPMNRWISRAHELTLVKRDNAIHVDSEGGLKLAPKAQEPTCETTGAFSLRQAFTRRSLAFDLARVATFGVMETWVGSLFELTLRPAPKGFQSVSLGQLVSADKQLFVLAAHALEGRLGSSSSSARPLDAEIQRLSVSHEVTQFLMPLPGREAPPKLDEPPPKIPRLEVTDPTGPGKGTPPKKTGGAGKLQIPQGCAARDAKGRPNCFGYNLGTCKLKVSKGRCARGYHQCWRVGCNKPHPFSECMMGHQ